MHTHPTSSKSYATQASIPEISEPNEESWTNSLWDMYRLRYDHFAQAGSLQAQRHSALFAVVGQELPQCTTPECRASRNASSSTLLAPGGKIKAPFPWTLSLLLISMISVLLIASGYQQDKLSYNSDKRERLCLVPVLNGYSCTSKHGGFIKICPSSSANRT